MERNGIDANRYFKKFRLPCTENYDPESLVPEKPFWYLINQVAIQEMIPDFGMQVAQAVPWYRIDSLQPLLKDKRSLRDLLHAFCDLASKQSNVSHFKVHEDKDICWFTNQGQLLVSNDIQMELYRVTSMIELIQLAAGNKWKPLTVHLVMPKNKIVGRSRVLDGCKLVFSQQQTAIAFPAGLLNATITTVIVTDSVVTNAQDETAVLDRMQDKTELVSALREIFYTM